MIWRYRQNQRSTNKLYPHEMGNLSLYYSEIYSDRSSGLINRHAVPKTADRLGFVQTLDEKTKKLFVE